MLLSASSSLDRGVREAYVRSLEEKKDERIYTKMIHQVAIRRVPPATGTKKNNPFLPWQATSNRVPRNATTPSETTGAEALTELVRIYGPGPRKSYRPRPLVGASEEERALA